MADLTAFPIPSVNIPTLPDVSPVTDASMFIMERAGTGRILATGLRDYISGGLSTKFNTVAALRANTSAASNACYVAGYSVVGDQGKGDFVLVATDTTTADDGGTVIVDAAGNRWYRDTASDELSVRWFGAMGDGTTDDTTALNQALAAAYAAHKTCYFPAGAYMVSDHGQPQCLFNPGCTMRGEGTDYSLIAPTAATSASADIVRVKPSSGGYIDFLEIDRIRIFPAYTGTARGKRALYLDFNQATNLGALHISGVYCAPGNDYSLYLDNAPAVNAQGVPSNSVIEQSMFWEGVHAVSTGDSVTFRNCVLRSTAGSARSGIYALIQTGADATSSHFIVEECNFDCAAAAVWALNGRNVKVLRCNIESSFGTGSSSGAIVDIDGTSGAVVMPEIKGNHVSCFGTSTVSNAIRVNAAWEADIDNNTILAGAATSTAILLTGNCNNAYVGLNEISTNFTTAVNNAGVGTRGVRIALAPGGGFANVGSGYAPLGYWQAKDGTVVLEGLLSCPATPSGLTICTLPAACCPPTSRRFPAYGVASESVTPTALDVTNDGVVTYVGSNTAQQVGFDGIAYPTFTGVRGEI